MDSRTDEAGPGLVAVGFALVMVLAGCTAGPTTDAPTGTPTQPATPSPAIEVTITPKPLPEQPETLTRETVVSFVSNFELAYGWNRELTDDTVELTLSLQRAEVLEATDGGFVVHLEVGFTKTVRDDGGGMVGDGYYTANYFVNETTTRRAQAGGQVRPGPDPLNGTVVGE